MASVHSPFRGSVATARRVLTRGSGCFIFANPGGRIARPEFGKESQVLENDLNPAEERVVEAFKKCEKFVIVKGDSLRGSFLRRLFLGEYGKWEPREVVIAGAAISELNMDYCQIRHPLSFHGCTFEEGISLRNSTLQALSLTGCVVMKNEGSDPAICAPGAEISGNVNLGEYGDDRFTAKGTVVLIGANIGGELSCVGGIFENDLILQRIKAESIFLTKNFQTKANVNLSGSIITGQLLCNDCCIGGNFSAQASKFPIAIFEEFKFMGNFNLSGSEFSEQFACNGGSFKGQLDFQDLRAGSVIFNNCEGKGEVDFNGAEIRGQLSCERCVFGGKLTAQGLKSRDVLLRKGFIAEDDVHLLGADISGQFDCTNGQFKGILNLIDAKVGRIQSNKSDWPKKGFLHLDGLHYQRLVGDAGESAESGLEWLARMKGDEFHPQPYEQLMAVYRRMGHTNWARKIGFELEKQRHRKFKKSKEREEGKDKDRGWWNFWYGVLRRTIGYGYKPFRAFRLALYGWLAGALLFGWANLSDCGLPMQSPKDLLWIIGGGNRSECSGCLLVPSEGDVLVSEDWKLRKQIPENYPQFVPAIYALEVLFPVFNFGQLDKWHLGNVWLSVARWLLTFSGTVLLAILTFFGIGVLGPRWRSDEDNS